MIIQISPTERIVGKENAWELQRLRNYKGSQKWEPCKWYRSFRQALEEAVHREIRLHPAVDLSEAIEAVSEVVHRFNQLLPDGYELRQKVNKHGG